MGVSTIPAASAGASDNWVQISSVTPTNATSTLSFTSISGYKKLMLRVIKPGTSASTLTSLTFNSDTGTNYAYSAQGISNYTSITLHNSLYGIDATNIPLGASGTNLGSVIIINEINTTGIKTINGFAQSTATADLVYSSLTGDYFASAIITSVTLTLSGGATYTGTGTVALYGVKI